MQNDFRKENPSGIAYGNTISNQNDIRKRVSQTSMQSHELHKRSLPTIP